MNLLRISVLLSLFFIISFNNNVGFADVKPKNPSETRFLKVTSNDQKVTFELCDTVQNSCRTLGNRSYTTYELNSLRHNLYYGGAGVLVIDVGLLVGGFYAGFVGGASLGISLGKIASDPIPDLFYWGFPGMGVAELTAGYLMKSVHFLNPLRRFKEARTIGLRVVSDENIAVADITKFANRLEQTLKQLN